MCLNLFVTFELYCYCYCDLTGVFVSLCTTTKKKKKKDPPKRGLGGECALFDIHVYNKSELRLLAGFFIDEHVLWNAFMVSPIIIV